MALDPFRGQSERLATSGNLIQKIGREEGEADHLLDPARGDLVTPCDCTEGLTLADRLIPAPGGEDVPGQNDIRAGGGVAQDDPGLDPAALQAKRCDDVPPVRRQTFGGQPKLLRQGLAIQPQLDPALGEVGAAQQWGPSRGAVGRIAVADKGVQTLVERRHFRRCEVGDEGKDERRFGQVRAQDICNGDLDRRSRQPPGVGVGPAQIGDQSSGDVVAQPLVVLLRMARSEAIAGLVKELADEGRIGSAVTRASDPRRLKGESVLHLLPALGRDDRGMLAVKDLVAMPDASGIDRVGQYLVDVTSGEGDAAGRAPVRSQPDTCTVPARIDEGFATILQNMQPTKGLFAVAKAMFIDAWEARRAEAQGAKDAVIRQAKEVEKQIEGLLDRLIEAASPSVVKAYETRIEKLGRDKLVLAERASRTLPEKGRLEVLSNSPWCFWQALGIYGRMVRYPCVRRYSDWPYWSLCDTAAKTVIEPQKAPTFSRS